ncbi:FAD/NAD(P)-binding domain-containing protein [Obba rivulosa]|uniref:FAD/NAD(P)-binding domain-containing protein n=1 Tax=Obba rivulosa TaxID=1052685 RepID=A0A8E2AWG4_9APHY|nr:FAD/NAD(P)-binding domain-containing protein [Obba rivulosa]
MSPAEKNDVRGKGLGGSSAMNVLLWTRPQREDFDGRPTSVSAIEALGNPGWNWEKFYHYSKKSEGLARSPINSSCSSRRYRFYSSMPESSSAYKELSQPEAVGLEGSYSSYNPRSRMTMVDSVGPLSVSFCRTDSGTEFPFQKLSGETSGTFKSASSIDATTGNRSYAATAYLRPALSRPNLKVVTGALVTKIITSKHAESVTAQGVEFYHGDAVYRVYAEKEVILCASGIKSPQILELSGIGNSDILIPLGIPVQVHLPSVGENIQEHICFTAHHPELRDDPGILTGEMLMKDQGLREKLRESCHGYEGLLALATTGLSFLPFHTFSERATFLTKEQKRKVAENVNTYPPGLREQYDEQIRLMENPNVPNLEIILYPFIVPGHNIVEKPRVWLLPVLSHPFSRGTIHITSSDPKIQPANDPRYFEEDVDFDILFDGVKFTRKVAETEPFTNLTTREVQPGPDITTDEQLRDTCGGCSMLPQDKGGVVDTNLKARERHPICDQVYGTENVRVVDLSVLPLMVAVHTQAIVYGIAEQAADIIKAEYNLTSSLPGASV